MEQFTIAQLVLIVNGESYAAIVRRLCEILERNEASDESTVRRLIRNSWEGKEPISLD